jgi:hypothetical protein
VASALAFSSEVGPSVLPPVSTSIAILGAGSGNTTFDAAGNAHFPLLAGGPLIDAGGKVERNCTRLPDR